jgi:hypothetical protein
MTASSQLPTPHGGGSVAEAPEALLTALTAFLTSYRDSSAAAVPPPRQREEETERALGRTP